VKGDAGPADRLVLREVITQPLAQGAEQFKGVAGHAQVPFGQVADHLLKRPGGAQPERYANLCWHDRRGKGRVNAGTGVHPAAKLPPSRPEDLRARGGRRGTRRYGSGASDHCDSGP